MSDKQTTQSVEKTSKNELESSEVEISLSDEQKELFDRMMEIGLFYGRSKSKTNPLMKTEILTTRSGFEVIDLHKTIDYLEKARDFIERKTEEGNSIIFVGTSPAAKSVIKRVAEELDVPYVVERWLGGTLTNFKTITDRINYFKKLKEDKETGELDKYTKKEQLQKSKELIKLDRLFGGISELKQIPGVMFIADLKDNKYPAMEAKAKGIPVVAIVNTDCDPKLVDYIIPANDRNIEAVRLIVEYLGEAVKRGKEKKVKLVEESENDTTENKAENIVKE